jgi:hypothetical protein
VECVSTQGEGKLVYRTITRNVSSGGFCFDADTEEFPVGTALEFQVQVPPGEGYFPSAGRVRGCGEIIRVDRLGDEGEHPRFGIAARFEGPLKAVF